MAFPLAAVADQMIAKLAAASGAKTLRSLDGTTLLSERAVLAAMTIPGRRSAGGGCRLFDAVGDTVALNLSRPGDRELLPALLEVSGLDTGELDIGERATGELGMAHQATVAACIARCDAAGLVARGRTMGLAIAREQEAPARSANPCTELTAGCPGTAPQRRAPRIIDLSALWAGPLAAHLLWLAGADVVKVESRTRPDAMRDGDGTFYALLNQGKASVVLDFADPNDLRALLMLIARADIVIEAARPRAMAQLGIDVAKIVRTTPGLVWITITGHGAEGDAANWVGFGDDCGVAGGLSAALRAASGSAGFVGDAIADPLSGLWAAQVAWDGWTSRRGGHFALAMSRVVASCLAAAREGDPAALTAVLKAWGAHVGEPFPPISRRSIGPLPALGADTRSVLGIGRAALQ